MIYQQTEEDISEIEEKKIRLLRSDASRKLELIAKLKPGEGLIIPSEHPGGIGVSYLQDYVRALEDVVSGNDMKRRRLFNSSMFDSPNRRGWEMKYQGKEYNIEISELKEGELYPEVIIRRRRK